MFRIVAGTSFQFPQLRVRYIVIARSMSDCQVSIPAAAGKIHGRLTSSSSSIINVSIPAAAGKIHSYKLRIHQKTKVSIPAAAGKIHINLKGSFYYEFVSIPAAAGKIHRKNNESTLHICGTICAAFCLCLLYYRGSLKPCLPFAQKAKRNFPVFVFSRVRSPVL